MQVDPRTVPFSIFGSYMTVNYLWWERSTTPDTPTGWYIRSVGAGSREVFEILLVRNNTVLTVHHATATPGRLTLSVDTGMVECTWADATTLRIRVRGCELQLRAVMRSWANAYQVHNLWTVVPDSQSDIYLCAALRGSLVADCVWRHRPSHDQVETCVLHVLPDADGVAEIAISTDEVQPRIPASLPAFDDSAQQIADSFARFLAPFPAVEPKYADARELAAYVLWVSTVAPRGHFKVPAVAYVKELDG